MHCPQSVVGKAPSKEHASALEVPFIMCWCLTKVIWLYLALLRGENKTAKSERHRKGDRVLKKRLIPTDHITNRNACCAAVESQIHSEHTGKLGTNLQSQSPQGRESRARAGLRDGLSMYRSLLRTSVLHLEPQVEEE